MVSGFFTSPKDHERIRSGEASAILIASKSSVGRCWLKRFSRSFMCISGIRESRFGAGSNRRSSVLLEFHVDRQRADFLDQHVEGLGHARDHLVFAVDDVLVRSEEHTSELQSIMRISY